MESAGTAQIAALVGALASALLLLAGRRWALLAGLVLAAAAGLGLVLATGLSGSADLISPAGAALGGIACVAVAAAALPFVRWPAAVPLAVLVAAPFRPPLEHDPGSPLLVSISGDGQLGRLLPLYLVVGAAAAALAWRTLRGERPRALPRVVALPAAAFFAFACASLSWAEDIEAGANLLLFFTLPFAVLLAVVARAPFPTTAPRALGTAGVVLAALFAAVGLGQAATHELFFFATNLEVSNANTDLFRVTSFFDDPSVYGRHLVIGLAILLSALAVRALDLRLALVLMALLWAGLLFSYSQSSMAALVLVTLAIAAAAGDRRVRWAVALVAVAALVAAGGYLAVSVTRGKSLDRLTSDRSERLEHTARVVAEHPVVGVGLGGQPRESRKLAERDGPAGKFVSHTTPLTVAAELGIVGLLLYGWLIYGGARLIAAVSRLHRGLGLGLAGAFLALFVHALFYSGFLEDPMTWLVLAVGAGFLTWPRRDGVVPRRRDGVAADAAERRPSVPTPASSDGGGTAVAR